MIEVATKRKPRSKSKSVSLMPAHTQIIESTAAEKGMGFSRTLQFILEDWQRQRAMLRAQKTTIQIAEMLTAK